MLTTVDILVVYRYLQLPLFCAERCWSSAMQLKSEANTEPRKHFHMRAKLKKAAVYSEELEVIGNSNRCDAQTKLECQVSGCLSSLFIMCECQQCTRLSHGSQEIFKFFLICIFGPRERQEYSVEEGLREKKP